MKTNPPEEIFAWLKKNPSLDELSAEFPELWGAVQRDIATIVANGTTVELQKYLKQSAAQSGLLTKKLHKSRGDKKILATVLQQIISNRMAHSAIRRHCISEATGIEKGKVRFNLLNGYVAQKLLFNEGLERKPVSMFWFRLIWPLIWQKKMLMPLVQPEGIYCFYSQELIDALVKMIDSRSCLEIAAGDGTLSHFISQKGSHVIATDDYSWKHEVKYPEFVLRQEAREALRSHEPEVVICSWPPANNGFEEFVFRTRSVQLYIVISSRHRFASGNWQDYTLQNTFDFEEAVSLSHLVVPPELDPAVYIFRRKKISAECPQKGMSSS